MRSTRSVVHLLNVAAARLKADHADPKLVADLQSAAKMAEARRVEGRDYSAEDEERISQQRNLFLNLPRGPQADALQRAMLQRAYDLMWDGDPIACDAIIEFLPIAEVTRMFDAWQDDQGQGIDGIRSAFYGETQ